MEVITLDNELFREACDKLWEEITHYDWIPDTIIGIADGGSYVADVVTVRAKMASKSDMSGPKDIARFDALCRRPHSEAKKKNHRLLKLIPKWIADGLRIAESRVLSVTDRHREAPEVELTEETKKRLAESQQILIVDDAVDSGITLKAVMDKVFEYALAGDVRTAVLTVTRKSPCIFPDNWVYPVGTLIRFPWSADSRETFIRP